MFVDKMLMCTSYGRRRRCVVRKSSTLCTTLKILVGKCMRLRMSCIDRVEWRTTGTDLVVIGGAG